MWAGRVIKPGDPIARFSRAKRAVGLSFRSFPLDLFFGATTCPLFKMFLGLLEHFRVGVLSGLERCSLVYLGLYQHLTVSHYSREERGESGGESCPGSRESHACSSCSTIAAWASLTFKLQLAVVASVATGFDAVHSSRTGSSAGAQARFIRFSDVDEVSGGRVGIKVLGRGDLGFCSGSLCCGARGAWFSLLPEAAI